MLIKSPSINSLISLLLLQLHPEHPSAAKAFFFFFFALPILHNVTQTIQFGLLMGSSNEAAEEGLAAQKLR